MQYTVVAGPRNAHSTGATHPWSAEAPATRREGMWVTREALILAMSLSLSPSLAVSLALGFFLGGGCGRGGGMDGAGPTLLAL